MTDPQPTRYLFVDCPDPKKLKLDRSKGSKSHVRAHVTKEYHRRVRMERLQAYNQKDPNAPPPATQPAMTATLAKDKLLPIRTNEAKPPSTRGGARGGRGRGRGGGGGAGAKGKGTTGKGKGKAKEEEEEEEGNDDTTTLAVVPAASSPEAKLQRQRQLQQQQQQQQHNTIREMGLRFLNSLLSQNRADPFNSLSIPDLPRYSQKVLDYALTNTWPQTVPFKGKSLDNPVNRAWLQSCLDNPALMHAFLYAASTQMSFLHGDREDPATEKTRLAHYSETIKQVYKSISTLQGPPADALLLTIVTLAVHGRPAKEPVRSCYPKSPLHTLQYLHIYGSMHLAYEHLPALMSLLERKGGLTAITTYGFRETLQLADIYFATLNCSKPFFPMVKIPPPILASGKIELDAVAGSLVSELLSGFKYLRASPCQQELADALTWIRDVTVATDLWERRVPGAMPLYDLVPGINTAQHKMLSVDANMLATNSEDVSIVCISRLAALVYNNMVIYPVPEIQGVRIRAAASLRDALEYHLEQFDFRPHASLLLWATVLGSIAASFTPEQPWFLRRLQWQAWESAIKDWPGLRSLCGNFLWWAPVCDEPGLRIWNDMIVYGSAHMMSQATD